MVRDRKARVDLFTHGNWSFSHPKKAGSRVFRQKKRWSYSLEVGFSDKKEMELLPLNKPLQEFLEISLTVTATDIPLRPRYQGALLPT